LRNRINQICVFFLNTGSEITRIDDFLIRIQRKSSNAKPDIQQSFVSVRNEFVICGIPDRGMKIIICNHHIPESAPSHRSVKFI